MVDLIVPRHEMKPTLATLIAHLLGGKPASANGAAHHREPRQGL
jgi:hypothetical protein